MSKSFNQKLKLLYLRQILLDNTDENHSITMQEIISELEKYGITAERKSLYNDIECLRLYGMDIEGEQKDRKYYYNVINRPFELVELKLLVDAVQSAKFITASKSNQLIKKIESLASKYEASKLQRQVYVADRVKTMNEKIYYNVDAIHAAIVDNSKITFQYYQWNEKKEKVLRRNGDLYEVSPWALSWDDENYYLIAYDSESDKIKHFRVDKMLNISNTGERREGREKFDGFNMAVYARKVFGMFSGEEETVKLECENSFAGVIIDRFGGDVTMIKSDENHFTVNVNVAVSMQFISWVMALGNGVKIIGPENVVEKVREEIARLNEQYGMK